MMQLGNGRWETAKYNDREQVTEIGLGATNATQNLLKLELGYGDNTENNGSLREQKITVPTADQTPGFVATQTYTYDDLNRIQSASETIGGTQTWKQTFIIDRYGNRRFDTTNNNTTTLGSCAEAVCNPDISTARNRITTAGYQYDENGNLTRDGEGKRFEYDAENHQNAFFLADNPTSTPDATYLYDGEGRRVKKISDTETTVFVYNAGGQLVAEYSTQIETVKPQVSYLTTDHLGSPRVVTDEDGRVTSRRDYTAFGEESVTPERAAGLGYAGQSETRKGYTGYEKDTESGLDFAQARYYNSKHGRFTSVDPLTASASIRNPQTFNRYTYVLNSPYKFTDPLGLIPETTGACGNRCRNSDGGGGGWAGRDSSFDWAVFTDAGVASAHESAHASQQQTQPPSLPYCSQGHMCFGEQAEASRAADASSNANSNDPSPEEIDRALASVFTDTGNVVGATFPRLRDSDGHTQFANGVVHTIHVVGRDAGVFVPSGFTDLVAVTSRDTVVIRNPTTGEVLMIAHVQVGTGRAAERLVRRNMKTVRQNGSIYIGKTGGYKGEGAPAVGDGEEVLPHSHIQYHPSESNRIKAYHKVKELRKNYGSLGDFTQKDFSTYVSDFRKLIK